MSNNNDLYQQIFNLLNKSQKILLLTHAHPDADGLGAMLSMHSVLKELGKDVTAVTSDLAPESLDFLPAMDIVQNSLASTQDFIITLDCSMTPVNKIKYNLEDKRVNIIISPKNGRFNPQNVTFSQGAEDHYDLLMVFDTGNLEHLGAIYEQNTEMFFKTPLINIDHHSSNTDFGQVNLVDVVSAATTEVLLGLLKAMEKQYNKKFISSDIATLLLAGLITDTGSFQHANTSPHAMETAAELMDYGARQQEIIKNIYKTKKLSTLKLWGIVLSKVQVDPVYRMVWSAVGREDLKEAGAASEETGSIIDDLLSNAPGAEVIMLIKHNDEGIISVSMRSTNNATDVGKLCTEMGGGGHVRAAGFKVKDGRTFEQVTSDVVTRVREFQAKRLNIHPEDLEGARQAATVNRPGPKLPLAEKQPTGAPPTGKETVLEFKVKPEAVRAPMPMPAPKVQPPVAKTTSWEPVKPAVTAEDQKRKRKRGKGGGGGNPGPRGASPAPAVRTEAPKPVAPKPAAPPPMPKPAPAFSTTPLPVTPTSTPTPAPAMPPAVAPAPIQTAPAAPVTPPAAVPATPTAPTPPVVPHTPPVTPAPSKPAPKTDSSPDVPDWLKAE